MSDERAYKWNETIPANEVGDDDFNFTLLPPGDYWAQVQRFETLHNEKRDAPMAKVVIVIGDDEGNRALSFEYMVLHSSSLWKLRQFFKGLGLLKDGEDFTMRWDKVPGRPCFVKLKQESYLKNGEEVTKNSVDKFYPLPDDEEPPAWAKEEVKQFQKKDDDEEPEAEEDGEEVPF